MTSNKHSMSLLEFKLLPRHLIMDAQLKVSKLFNLLFIKSLPL